MLSNDSGGEVREVTAKFRVIPESISLSKDCHLPVHSMLSVGLKIDKSLCVTKSFPYDNSQSNTKHEFREILEVASTLLLDRQQGTYRTKIGKLLQRTKVNMYGRDTVKTLAWLPLYLHEIVKHNLELERRTYDFATLHGVSVTFTIAATITKIAIATDAHENEAQPAMSGRSESSTSMALCSPRGFEMSTAEAVNAIADTAVRVGTPVSNTVSNFNRKDSIGVSTPCSPDSLQSPGLLCQTQAAPMGSLAPTRPAAEGERPQIEVDSLDSLQVTSQAHFFVEEDTSAPRSPGNVQSCSDSCTGALTTGDSAETTEATAVDDASNSSQVLCSGPPQLEGREVDHLCVGSAVSAAPLTADASTMTTDTCTTAKAEAPCGPEPHSDPDPWLDATALQYFELAEENRTLLESLIQVKVGRVQSHIQQAAKS